MALQKEITLENGITLNYHRIVSIMSIVNMSTTIEVGSYADESKRLEEKEYQELQKKSNRTEKDDETLERGINVYIDTNYVEVPYDEKMDVNSAYKYLETLDKYKGSKNV